MKESAAPHATPQELVTFFLDEDEYGIDVNQVIEVNRDLIWTPVPGARPYVRGAANLRGQIVTVLDIRRILNYEERPEDLANTVIVVTSRNELVGILVDRIADVIMADQQNYGTPPKNLPELQRRCISSVLKEQGQLIAILNLDEALD
ncbi:MAG: chemotaxis protein CheW [Thermodesulfobacteriota bacterium]